MALNFIKEYFESNVITNYSYFSKCSGFAALHNQKIIGEFILFKKPIWKLKFSKSKNSLLYRNIKLGLKTKNAF